MAIPYRSVTGETWRAFERSGAEEIRHRAERDGGITSTVTSSASGLELELYREPAFTVHATCNGTDLDVRVGDLWEWLWFEAMDSFPSFDPHVADVLVQLSTAKSEGRCRLVKTWRGDRLRCDIDAGRFVVFGRRGRFGSLSSSNIV